VRGSRWCLEAVPLTDEPRGRIRHRSRARRASVLAWWLAASGCGHLDFGALGASDASAVGDGADSEPVDALPACASVGFAPAPSPTAAMGPRDLVMVDLDGDGKLDVASVDESGALTVLIGNGDGTFQPAVIYASDVDNWSIAVGDLNGDSKPDLVAGNFNANTESVFINNGDGTFKAKVDYATGAGPQSSAIGDVNDDGKLDVVVADYSANTVSVLLGNGDGTLRAKTDVATNAGPYSVAVVDLNHDGKPDLAVADQGGCGGCNGNYVSVLLGHGDGTFASKVDYATGSATQPWHITSSDFDRDGNADLAVANNYGASASAETISILRGDGHGAFQPHKDTPTDPYPWYLAVADFDADGKPDLVVANGQSNSVSLLLGNGDATFRPKTDFPAANQPLAVAVGDLDGDGRPDVVTADSNASSLTVLLLSCTL